MEKKSFLMWILFWFALIQFKAQSYTQSFDDVTTLATAGWSIQNNSSPVGALSWFQRTLSFKFIKK